MQGVMLLDGDDEYYDKGSGVGWIVTRHYDSVGLTKIAFACKHMLVPYYALGQVLELTFVKQLY